MAIFTGIAAAVTGLMSSTFLSGAVGSFLLRTAVGVGLNLLAQAIAGKPKEATHAINGTLQGGGDIARSFILGRYTTAGSLVWANTWGKDGDTPNAYLTQVIALSDLPVKGLLGVWVNGEKVTLDLATSDLSWGWQVKEYRSGGDNLWVKFFDGTQTVADPFLVNTCSNSNRRWAPDRVGRGISYVVITARVSKNMFSGIPNFKFEVDGLRLYDPSKDSSVGGNGAQRYGDPATWGGDGDYLPAVQAYNLLRGTTYNNEWFYGVQGMSAARLPPANWIAAINKCRLQVQGAEGLEPQYRSGAEIIIDAPLSTALEGINTSCQGRIAEIGGVYHMYVGAPDAPVIHFTDDDILSTEEQSFTPFLGLSDTINGVRATYPSPADGWVVKTAPPLYRRDLEAKHGNRRLMASIELSFVPYAEQVQRLIKSALEEGQRARRHTHVMPPKFWAYAVPGVVWSWTSKRNGYVTKLMRVDGAADRANLDNMVDLTEVDPSDYKWNSGTDYRPPIDGAVGPMRPLPQPIVDFFAEPSVAQDNEGNNRRCAILLGWDGDKVDVDLVRFEVRLASTLAVIYTGRTEDVKRGSINIAPGILLPNTDYDVCAQYDTYSGNRPFERSDWIRVRTDDIRLGPLDLYPFSVENFNKGLQEFWRDQSQNVRRIDSELTRVATALSDLESDSEFERAGIREEVGKQGANFRHLILVEANERKSQVTRLEELDAQLAGNIANVLEFAQATATELEAVSQSVTQTKAEVDNVSASGYLQIYSEAAPTGSLSRVVFAAVAESWGARTQGAFALEAKANGKSSVIFDADEFYFSNGSARDRPVAIRDGELTLTVINMGTGYFDNFISRNRSLWLRGYGNYGDIRLFTIGSS